MRIANRMLIFVLIFAMVAGTTVSTVLVASDDEDEREIIVDNADPGFTTDSQWTASTYTPSYYGKNYITTNSDPDKWAKWTPDIPETDDYNIYMRWPAGGSRPKEAPLEIKYGDGVDTQQTINQQKNDGEWVLIGKYHLLKGTDNYVKLSASGTGSTVADAVKFERVSAGANAVAAKTPQVLQDVQGSVYEEAVSVLNTLNIMEGYEDGAFKPEHTVTRAEFAVVLTKMLGFNDAGSEKRQTAFSDVPSDYWASGYIKVAADLKIITGYEDGTFKPESLVSYEEAVKMIVSGLGYDLTAQQNGGYPAGYMAVASQKKITKGITGQMGNPVTRGIVAQLAYNALDVDYMKQTGFGDETKLTVTSGQSLLTDIFKTEKLEGRVTATADTTLTGESSLSEDEVQIDGITYKTGATNAEQYLGYVVRFYYVQDDNQDEKTLIFIKPKEDENRVVTVKADEIGNVQFMVGYTMFEYWPDEEKNGDIDTVKIASSADVIYNGKALASYTEQDLKPVSGEVILIDADQDNQYDIIRVTSYDTMVVEEVSTSTGIIKNKMDMPRELVLDSNDQDIKFSILKAGKKVKLKDLKEWNVLSVATSKDGSLIQVLVSDDSITGTVTEKSDSELFIDGKEYDTAAVYPDNMEIGDEGTFYLDSDHKIAFVDRASTPGDRYAYLYKIAVNGGVEGTVQFKMFTVKDGWKIFDCADKVKLNGDSGKNSSDIAKSALLFAVNAKGEITTTTIPQLITYELNSDGKICSVETADAEGSSLRKSTAATTLKYKSSSKSFSAQVYFDQDTVILKIPDQHKDIEDEYKVEKTSDFIADQSYKIESYNETEYNVSGFILLIQDDYGYLKNNVPVLLVDRVADAVNSDGEVVKKIIGLQDGRQAGLIISENASVPDVKQGDILRNNTNSKGEISGASKMFDITNIQNGVSGTYDSYLQTVCGRVYRTSGGRVKIDTSLSADGTGLSVWDLNGVQNIYKYDQEKGKLSVVSLTDIREGMMIFLRAYNSKVMEAVIYIMKQ